MTSQQLYDELLHLFENEAKAEAVRCLNSPKLSGTLSK